VNITIFAALAAVLAVAAAAPTTAPAVHTDVVIEDYAFKAATVTVTAGTEVEWTNKDDDPHTVTADDKSFDSKGLGQGDVYRHRFDTPGRYAYHCAAHPFMRGVIIVNGGASK
jgi:plastocyanin